MKKSYLIFLSLILLSVLALASCNGAEATEIQSGVGEEVDSSDVVTDQPAVVATEPLGLITNEPAVETAEATQETQSPPLPEELPDIPAVKLGPGDAWFRPTNPSQIQLASGKVQVFKFSASW